MWFRRRDPHPSLRGRLLAAVLAAIAFASLAQGIVAYRGALSTADAIFDSYLQEVARAVQGGQAPGVDLYEYSVRAWGPSGVEIYSSRGARVPDQPVIGFSDTEADGARWRVYQLRSGERTIQVAQNLDARQARARALALDAVLPTALLAPLLMLAVALLIRHTVAPVDRVRRQLAARRVDDLSPLPEEGLPREVAPLVEELNELLARAQRNIGAQQRFIADAAHELRSPLAALKLQAQALRRTGAGAPDDAVVRLNEGIDRLIALASQLLALARAEAEPVSRRDIVNLEAVCADVIAEFLPQAHARDIDMGLSHADAATVQGDADGLRMLVRNFVDNAVKYSPQGGRVDVSVLGGNAGATVCVEDNGPGIGEHQLQQALERFARLPGHDRVPGSGLGLSIAAAVARSHGAKLELGRSEKLGGLRACVHFPPPA
jgi:two-component system OmpR family sensor kinase